MSRRCARPGCSQGAVATLSYAYADSIVYLEDLAVEDHPMTHDLCPLHAEAVRVPRGWELDDTRPVEGTQPIADTAGGTPGSDPPHAVAGRSSGDPGGAALRLVGA